MHFCLDTTGYPRCLIRVFSWRNFASLAIQTASSEDSAQTIHIYRLIWIFTGYMSERMFSDFVACISCVVAHTNWGTAENKVNHKHQVPIIWSITQEKGLYTISCTTWEKAPYVIMGTAEVQITCTSMQSDPDILCLSTYTTISINSVSGQQRPRSACTFVQADLGLCCPQIA